MRELGTTLHGMKASSNTGNMQLHFVIPPPTDPTKDARSFSRADMAVLGNTVDGLSMMTYDFSGPSRPGPNAPASWIRSTLQMLPTNDTAAPEVLLGLNFYGNDFTLPLGMQLKLRLFTFKCWSSGVPECAWYVSRWRSHSRPSVYFCAWTVRARVHLGEKFWGALLCVWCWWRYKAFGVLSHIGFHIGEAQHSQQCRRRDFDLGNRSGVRILFWPSLGLSELCSNAH